MRRIDLVPRFGRLFWSEVSMLDGTDVVGRSIRFEWLGVAIEIGTGRRNRDFERGWPDGYDILREIAPLPIDQQWARLKQIGGTRG